MATAHVLLCNAFNGTLIGGTMDFLVTCRTSGQIVFGFLSQILVSA